MSTVNCFLLGLGLYQNKPAYVSRSEKKNDTLPYTRSTLTLKILDAEGADPSGLESQL